jgi:hypothetical protein
MIVAAKAFPIMSNQTILLDGSFLKAELHENSLAKKT